MSEFNCQCQHCKHEWIRRTFVKPKSCPKCKRYNWDKKKPKK